MIAIMTWNEELNEELKLKLNSSRIVDSKEELEDDIDYLDKVIISKHSEWTIDELKELLLKLKDSGVEIIYITKAEAVEEIKTCTDLGIKDFLIEPVTVEEITRKTEITGGIEETTNNSEDNQFNTIEYLDSIYDEMQREEILRLRSLVESKENEEDSNIENDDTEDKKIAGVKKAEPVIVENVQPVETVKQESTFRFLLNFVHKLLSLFVHVIVTIIEYIPWLIGSAIVLIAANYFIKEQGVNSFPELLDLAKGIIDQFIK